MIELTSIYTLMKILIIKHGFRFLFPNKPCFLILLYLLPHLLYSSYEMSYIPLPISCPTSAFTVTFLPYPLFILTGIHISLLKLGESKSLLSFHKISGPSDNS